MEKVKVRIIAENPHICIVAYKNKKYEVSKSSVTSVITQQTKDGYTHYGWVSPMLLIKEWKTV